MSDDRWVDRRLVRLAELRAAIGALQAEQWVLLAAIDADPVTSSLPGVADKNWAVEDVGCALESSPGSARAVLAQAREAVRLPRLLDLLGVGAISVGHVRAVTDQTVTLTDAQVAAAQDRVLPRAAELSVGALRGAVRRAVLAVTGPSIEQRRLANVAERRVCLRPGGEGTTELWALLPDEGAAALMSAVTALADRRGEDRQSGDERSADQRRADALVQLGLDSFAGQVSRQLPRRQRLRPAVQVTIALSTLLQLNNEPAELTSPGTAGTTPISAELGRRLAADPSGTWRRLVTDPVGQLLDYGRRTYLHPPRSPAMWWPATAPAASRTAPAPRTAANSTTPCPGKTAELPTPPTSRRCAPATTTYATTPPGATNATQTAPPNGPPPPAPSTPPPPPPTPPTPTPTHHRSERRERSGTDQTVARSDGRAAVHGLQQSDRKPLREHGRAAV